MAKVITVSQAADVVLEKAKGYRTEVREVIKSLNLARAGIDKRIAELNEFLGVTSGPAKVKAKGTKTRTRRTAAQVQAEAGKIHDLIKATGKEGLSGGEIRRRFPKIQSISDMMKDAGLKIKKIGNKGKGVKYMVE